MALTLLSVKAGDQWQDASGPEVHRPPAASTSSAACCTCREATSGGIVLVVFCGFTSWPRLALTSCRCWRTGLRARRRRLRTPRLEAVRYQHRVCGSLDPYTLGRGCRRVGLSLGANLPTLRRKAARLFRIQSPAGRGRDLSVCSEDEGEGGATRRKRCDGGCRCHSQPRRKQSLHS